MAEIKTMGATSASPFSKIINWGLALIVFLTPVLFLPFTSEAREFNKLTFVFLGVVVLLGVWVIKTLTTKTISWVRTPLDFVLLAYLGVYLIASFMSLDQVSSFLGYYGRFAGGFMSVAALVVLYYLIVNNVRSSRMASRLMDFLLVSGALVMAYSLLQIFGVYVIRAGFAMSPAFNPIGSLVSLGIFSVLMILLSQWAWLTRGGSVLKQSFYGLVSLMGLVILFLVNAFVAWLILALSMIAFLALAVVMTADDRNQSWIWKPLLVLVVAVLFVGFQFLPRSMNPRNAVGSMNLPVEIQLSGSATREMAKNALSEKPLLGFGPGTTGIAFGQIKPETLNQSIAWSLSFDRASSEIANITIETGILGLLAFEALSIFFLIYAALYLLRRKDHVGRDQAFGLFMVWLAVYISHFFYFYNSVMYLMFWFSMALFMAVAHLTPHSEDNRHVLNSPKSALSWTFASLLMLAVLLIGGFFQVATYFADVAYASGIKELNKQEPDLNRASDLFARAIQRNQYRDVYYLAYGQNLVFRAAREARKENPDVAAFRDIISQLISAGNSATSLSPNKASNWASRGRFFSQIRALAVPGTDEVIVASSEEAVKKDNRNPILHLQLAQAYSNASESIDPKVVSSGEDKDGDGLSDQNETELGSNPQNSDSNGNGVSDGDEVKAGFNPAGTGRLTTAQLAKFTKIDEDKLRKAEQAAKAAIELKNDLPDSYIVLSRIYEKWGKLSEARVVLEKGTEILPNNTDMRYELGRVIFNQKEFSAAEAVFNQVVKLVPNHANARYSLGLVALQKNDRTKALAEFERTLEIVGTNEELRKIIDDLKTQLQQPAQTTDSQQ